MGDMFSSKKTSTSQTTVNEQVALQGTGQVGRIQSGGNTQVAITMTDASDVALYANRDITLEALKQMGQSSVKSHETALEVSRVGAVQTMRAFDSADNALAVADGVVNASHQSVIQTLAALVDVQKNANETTSMAVAAAQDTALRATPYSPGAYAEVIGAQDNDAQQQLIFLALGSFAIIGLVVYSQRKS